MKHSFKKGLLLGLVLGTIIPTLVFSGIIYIRNQDGYYLVKLVPAPNNQQVAAIISNMGGGGPGYCRDLVYIFPNISQLPDFSKEKDNEKYLVKREQGVRS